MPVYVPNPDPLASTPANLFDDLGAEIAARYAEAEQRMIERVATLARAGIAESPSIMERRRILAELRAEGERIAEQLNDPAFVARIVDIAARDGEAAAVAALGVGGVTMGAAGITTNAANATAQIALDLSSRLADMSARITRWMPDAYQRVISMVSPSVVLGVETLAQAQARAAEQFLARGVRGFVDSAGKEWRIGTYSEMATRTTVNRAWQSANIFAAQSAGINLVTIVIGVDACKVCAAHAGKIYSTDGTPAGTYQLEHTTQPGRVSVTVAGTIDQARAEGWNHPNCRCVLAAYLPGLSIVTGTTHDPQAEADRDRLRALERRVRELKRREAAAFADVTKGRLRGQIKDAQRDIREHVAATGQLRKNYREQLAFSDGRRPALPPSKPRAITR